MFARRTTIAVAVLASLACAWSVAPTAALAQKGDKAASVGVDPVIEELTHQTVPVIGRLVAQSSGVVSALVRGVVAEMRVHVGDRVKAGDVLVALAPNALKSARDLRRSGERRVGKECRARWSPYD